MLSEGCERGGLALESCGDINAPIQPLQSERDAKLHLAMTAYVPLHAGCAGHVRLARASGSDVIEPGEPANPSPAGDRRLKRSAPAPMNRHAQPSPPPRPAP